MDTMLAQLEGIERAAGPTRLACQRLVEHLEDQERLDVEHLPMVAVLYKLADTLDHAAGGRGASIALVAAQFKDYWASLATLPMPVGAEDDGPETYDVVLLPAALPDAS